MNRIQGRHRKNQDYKTADLIELSGSNSRTELNAYMLKNAVIAVGRSFEVFYKITARRAGKAQIPAQRVHLSKLYEGKVFVHQHGRRYFRYASAIEQLLRKLPLVQKQMSGKGIGGLFGFVLYAEKIVFAQTLSRHGAVKEVVTYFVSHNSLNFFPR